MPERLLDLGKTNRLVVVSDVHMRTPEDSRTEIFCRFLDELRDCDTLVLLGDIFDFINARQVFYHRLWEKVFTRLKRIRERGVRVVFIEGNHDYGFEHAPCLEVRECFDFCGDFVGRIQHSVFGNMLLLHSDDVVCPPSYRVFRSLVKSSLFQSCMSPIPGSATSFLFSRYAQLSRSKDAYRKLSNSFLTSCVEEFLSTKAHTLVEELKLCVFGHIHVQLDDTLNDVRFLSGPDWFSAPSAMTFSAEGHLHRSWLRSDVSVPERFLFASQGVSPQSAPA
ncbi:MAG: hypothetical protein FJY29_01385 [Betaproteobacteria bacterium]|nr:hypothetical protein [Betaproteobacteria bacterium]